MNLSGLFIINSIFLGVGLAADAFSVSVVNGLSDPDPQPRCAVRIAAVFAFFQALMPMLGWVLAHTMLRAIASLQSIIPIISMALLGFLGTRMICSSLKNGQTETALCAATGAALLTQGVATSLDALSVGLVYAACPWHLALLASLIIAAVTFLLCWFGVLVGKTVGVRLAGKAELLGGTVLILIGLQIFLRSL